MGCERYESELTEAAIGAPASPDLDRHLARCEACRSRLEGERRLLEGVDRGLRDVLRIDPSPGFDARLLVAARRSRRAAKPFSWWHAGPTLALAAGLGLLLVAGWLAWESQRPAPLPRRVTIAPPPLAPSRRESATEPRIAVADPTRPAALPSLRAPRSVPPRREPEVLVPPGREEALVQFVAMLRDPRVEPPKALTETIDPETPLPDIQPIEILDLETKPSDPVPLDGRSRS